jgi:hypothetical protein
MKLTEQAENRNVYNKVMESKFIILAINFCREYVEEMADLDGLKWQDELGQHSERNKRAMAEEKKEIVLNFQNPGTIVKLWVNIGSVGIISSFLSHSFGN